MEFRKASNFELDQVNALYVSARMDPFCAWDDVYPGIHELTADSRAGTLYVLVDGNQLVGALSIVPENELDTLSCWKSKTGRERELARITILKDYRGRGFAAYMVSCIISALRELDCPAIHLSAAKSNIPAVKTYRKLGFASVGEESLYGGSYYMFEMIL